MHRKNAMENPLALKEIRLAHQALIHEDEILLKAWPLKIIIIEYIDLEVGESTTRQWCMCQDAGSLATEGVS